MNTEVIIEKHGKRHIADINSNGYVIELQNSPISPEEIISRESFYDKMIWIFNAKNFWFHTKKKQNYYYFKWSRPKKSLFYCNKRILFDLDNEYNVLFWLSEMDKEVPCEGYGYYIHKNNFINWIKFGEKIRLIKPKLL